MLVHVRDRPAERREPGDDIALADLRHLEQRRPAVVRVGPAPDRDAVPRASAVRDSVVGRIPSRSASCVGVIGWKALIALATAKSLG